MEPRTTDGATVRRSGDPGRPGDPRTAAETVRYIAGGVLAAGGRIEAVRELGGVWSRSPLAPPVEVLELALAAGNRVRSGLVVTLPERAWSFAYDLGPVSNGTDRRVVVVSWSAHPGRAEARVVELLMAGARDALERVPGSELADEHAAGASLSERGAATILDEVRRAVRAIAVEVAAEGGVASIARVTGMLIGRSVRVVDASGAVRAAWGDAALAGPVGLTARGAMLVPPAGTAPAIVRSGSWSWLPVVVEGEVAGGVAVHDPSDSLGGLGEIVVELAGLVLELWGLASADLAGEPGWRRLAEALAAGRSEEVRSRAARLVPADAPPWRAALVELPGGVPLSSVLAGLVTAGLPPLAAAAASAVLVVVPDTREGADHLDRLAGNPGYRMGVGASAATMEEVARSIDEARLALRVGPASSGAVRFDELGTTALVASLGDVSRLESLVEKVLGPLVEYDRTHHRELVATLGAYLDHAGSVERAAEAMGVHRSTMKYRMGRIRELADLDLTDPDARFELQFATRAAAVLRAMEPDHPPG
ncbi:MAG: helix-turn-helix domain-containing protein [Actinomycetota bacterium]|jgi:hypothetical protein|nr:helix-turn-helix domain-containing protein [Actinomycetota bacterium]